MNYKEAWQFLDNLQFFKIKLGLSSMNLFLNRLGAPHKKLRYVHVAGTNGKGSVSSTLLSILSSAGYKVGFYSSPHLSSVRERFRVNDSYIDEASFARLSKQIVDVLQKDQITYFEFTTTLAFLWFAEQDVDIAILEVGMGGRLDATNVVNPLVSVITNISIDHQEHLGNTIKSIAFEKAGIIKTGTPVLCGSLVDDALQVVQEICEEKHASCYKFFDDFSCSVDGDKLNYEGIKDNFSGLQLKLSGKFQAENTAIALAAIEILKQNHFDINIDAVKNGVSKVMWPGRLESLEIRHKGKTLRCLLDGAHNIAGITALIDTLKSQFVYKKLILVWASMSDKDFSECLAAMLPLSDRIIFTRPDKNRSATLRQLKDCVPETQLATVLEHENVNDAVKAAIELASPEDLICIAGSLYLVGHARLFLCGEIVDG